MSCITDLVDAQPRQVVWGARSPAESKWLGDGDESGDIRGVSASGVT